MVVHTKYSSNAFVDRAIGLALEQSLVCARGVEVRVLNDATFVTVDGKYVTMKAKFVCSTEAKFVQDLIVFNYIQYSDVDAFLNSELRNTV